MKTIDKVVLSEDSEYWLIHYSDGSVERVEKEDVSKKIDLLEKHLSELKSQFADGFCPTT